MNTESNCEHANNIKMTNVKFFVRLSENEHGKLRHYVK